jgi:hypothetical protein
MTIGAPRREHGDLDAFDEVVQLIELLGGRGSLGGIGPERLG